LAGAILFLGYTSRMASKIYESDTITLLDGTELYLTPLKIKYLREFMDLFDYVKDARNDDQAILFLTECAKIAMKQYAPDKLDLEDNADIHTVYKILEVAAGIKIKPDSKETVKEQAVDSGATWQTLDLAKLEAEVFLLGIWKDYEQLESSLSMPELTATLESKRELDYNEKKFLAAIQGVDLDKNSGKQNEWEEMKARVFSKGKTGDPNDVVALQGANAQKAGFGIGMGLSYQKVDKK
jgi:hypothetical protein